MTWDLREARRLKGRSAGMKIKWFGMTSQPPEAPSTSTWPASTRTSLCILSPAEDSCQPSQAIDVMHGSIAALGSNLRSLLATNLNGLTSRSSLALVVTAVDKCLSSICKEANIAS